MRCALSGVRSDAEIGDIKKARLLLKSVIQTNPKHPPGAVLPVSATRSWHLWHIALVALVAQADHPCTALRESRPAHDDIEQIMKSPLPSGRGRVKNLLYTNGLLSDVGPTPQPRVRCGRAVLVITVMHSCCAPRLAVPVLVSCLWMLAHRAAPAQLLGAVAGLWPPMASDENKRGLDRMHVPPRRARCA